MPILLLKGDVAVTEPRNAKRNKSIEFENNALFFNFISKIKGVQIDNAEDLDVVIPM